MFRLTVLLFMTRLMGFIALGYYAFWMYSSNIRVDHTFDLKKVSLVEQRDALSDLKKIKQDSHRNILRAFKARNEDLMLMHHQKVLANEQSLIDRKEIIEANSDNLDKVYSKAQLDVINANLGLISFYKKRHYRNQKSLRYNFPDTHTNKLNKILESYRALTDHVVLKTTLNDSWDTVNHDLQTIPLQKSKSRVGLNEQIKQRGIYLFVFLFFLFAFDLIFSVFPHRGIRKFLAELKEDRYPADMNYSRAFEWKNLSSLLNLLRQKLLTRSKRLDNILQNIKVAVFSVDKMGLIAGQYSQVADNMFPGFSKHKCFYDFLEATFDIAPDDTKKLVSDLFLTKERKEFEAKLDSSVLPSRIYLKKGSPQQRIVTIDLVDKRDENGELLEILVFCRDKTEQITAQEKLVEDEKRFQRIQRAAVGINHYF